MPFFDAEEAAAVRRGGDGLGPVYGAMLAAEEARQGRYGRVGARRRPDHVLQAMRRREDVVVPVSLLPVSRELRERHGWRMGDQVTITVDI